MSIRRCGVALTVLVGLLIGSISVLGARRLAFIRSPLAVAPDVLLESESDESDPDKSSGWILEAPGIRQPSLVGAAQADLPDSAKVIGVIVKAGARAYLLSAMEMSFRPPAISRHVVNDWTNGTAVSATYCDLNGCVRVFAKSDRTEPLELGIGGARDGKMLLLYEGERYAQDSPEIPLEELPFSITTWAQWKRDHPDTLVYTKPY